MPTGSLNKILGGIAVVVALPALFIGNPVRGHRVSVDLNELSSIIEKEDDHWTTDELADTLMAGTTGLRIVDLRDSSDYARARIPGAERIPLPDLLGGKLRRNETILLYSEGGTHASQAWILLRADGYRNVYTLKGGMLAWEEDVLYPAPSSNPSILARARFFGGTPAAAADTVSASGNHSHATNKVLKKTPLRPNVLPEEEHRRDGC